MKVLNLYSGIGGNRKLWQNVEEKAVEMNEEIAAIYKEYFPGDTVIIADAHEYLLKHYKEFDFIWSSPPCPTHSRAGFWGGSRGVNRWAKFPDMKLWQEIIFLKHYCKAKYVVENVIPFYEPFLMPTIELQRHLFWSNFNIRYFVFAEPELDLLKVNKTDSVFGFNLKSKRLVSARKDTVLRNLVNPEIGLYILEQAQGIIRQEKVTQPTLNFFTQ